MFNGSPPFTGTAKSDESNIRRWILEDGKEVLWVEGTTGGQPIEARDRVREAAVRYDLIRDNALSAEDSVAFIVKTMEQL